MGCDFDWLKSEMNLGRMNTKLAESDGTCAGKPNVFLSLHLNLQQLQIASLLLRRPLTFALRIAATLGIPFTEKLLAGQTPADGYCESQQEG